MKNTALLLLFTATIFSVNAQKNSKNEGPKVFGIDTTKAFTIDSTIKTLYKTISGEKGEARNWGQFKFLFYKDAKLIPSGRNNERVYKARYLSADDYVKNSGKWLVQNGFIEKEIKREVQQFGNLAHVFSTYECYNSKTDEKPFMRGINSIQLMFDGSRWWILNIYWTNENKFNPIPRAYLPKS
ncbi:hypothetical protein FUA26_07400 [Seonamhaeicola algicola]|uniref:Nuclear transport factor 2 family protein n=1 Tax=Seonamhaeicola algicola TaxID=1719036 RepID=A0A5C7AU23_9FLAO|nr:hypothetical protein [Seonamhaeicola algicola]TXE11881.1 hypothetical protein FUA26_07400 [Seonamhaeicola algicola]